MNAPPDVENLPAQTRRPAVAARIAYAVAAAALLVCGYWLYRVTERYGTGRWRAGASYRIADFIVLETSFIFAALLLLARLFIDRRAPLARVRRRVVEAIVRPSPRGRLATAAIISLASAAYLAYTAHRQGHDFDLRIHDENMYMVQAQTIAHGRLWMPPHPHPDFFESFHLYARPVYGSMYFPGTGLFYAIPVRLGLPTWAFSLGLSALCVGLIYLAVARVLDGAAGLLAALMALTINPLRYFAVMLMSHPLLMALGLLMFLALMRWREDRRARWLVALGVCGGWAAITRPVDGMCYAAPLGLLFLWELRRSSWGAIGRAVATVVLAATPLLALQLLMNWGMTGRVLKTPVQNYLETYWPEMQMGDRAARGSGATDTSAGPTGGARALSGGRGILFPKNSMSFTFEYAARQIRYWQHQSIRPALSARLPTPLPQYRDYYLDFVIPNVQAYQVMESKWVVRERLRLMFQTVLPATPLVMLVPLALLGLTDRRRWALVGVLPLFWGAYLFFPFFLDHYVLVVAPAILFATVLGMRALARAASSAGPLVATFLIVAIVQFSIRGLPEFSATGELDQPASMDLLRDVKAKLARLPGNERALVFFRYHPEDAEEWKQEPVYTLDAPWPDQARVIRAHDLGERDAELVGYYAKTQPDRRVYRYDMLSREMTELGLVKDLAR